MLYKKAGLLKMENDEWEDVKLKADYIRNSVLEVALKLEKQDDFLKSPDAVWVLYTIAEGFNYKNNTARQKEYEDKADESARQCNNLFAPGSYKDQKEKITDIFQNLN